MPAPVFKGSIPDPFQGHPVPAELKGCMSHLQKLCERLIRFGLLAI